MRSLKKLFVCAVVALGINAPAFAGGGPATVVDVVLQSGEGFDNNRFDYDILLEAVITADLVGLLSDPNAEYTIFAPNDRAFIRLARDLGYDGHNEAAAWDFLVEQLTVLGEGNPIGPLTDILAYHVVTEELGFFDIVVRSIFRQDITTFQGGTITPRFFRLKDNDPNFKDPRLFFPLNVRTGNGTIHTIQRVLLPSELGA